MQAILLPQLLTLTLRHLLSAVERFSLSLHLHRHHLLRHQPLPALLNALLHLSHHALRASGEWHLQSERVRQWTRHRNVSYSYHLLFSIPRAYTRSQALFSTRFSV